MSHLPLWQSVGLLQVRPLAHFLLKGHPPPPQSTSPSPLFFTPDGNGHVHMRVGPSLDVPGGRRMAACLDHGRQGPAS